VAYITQPNQTGIANALLQAHSFIHDEFLCLLGDTLLTPKDSLRKLVEFHTKRKPVATILVTHVNDVRGYGIIDPSGDEVRRVIEKPQRIEDAPSKLAMVGCYAFSQKIFDAAKRTGANPRTGEIELTDALQNLIESGEKVCYLEFQGTYIDTGKLGANGTMTESESTN
jgi:glucose-1-phosphate thymidylyltransferase